MPCRKNYLTDTLNPRVFKRLAGELGLYSFTGSKAEVGPLIISHL